MLGRRRSPIDARITWLADNFWGWNILLILICIKILPNTLKSQDFQHYHHTGLWARWMITAPLQNSTANRWSLYAEYWHGRQSDYHAAAANPLTAPAFHEARVLLINHRKNWNILLSPFAILYTWQRLGKESDYEKKMSKELRFMPGLERKFYAGKTKIQLRVLEELRFQDYNNYAMNGRFRGRLQIQRPLWKKTSAAFIWEYFANTGPHKKKNTFDQNWLMLNFIMPIANHLWLECGYMYNIFARGSLTEFDHEQALNIGLHLNLTQ